MNIKKYFRHPTFRPYQKESIEALIEGYESGYRFQILEAPTGAGKSDTYMAVKNWLEDTTRDGGMIISTPLKSLQNQLVNDFPSVPSIMGRNNYTCNSYPNFSCDARLCDIMALGRDQDGDERHGSRCSGFSHAIRVEASARSVIVNFSMLLAYRRLRDREMLVIDEAQAMDDFLLSHMAVTFSRKATDFFTSEGKTPQEYIPELENLLLSYADKVYLYEREMRTRRAGDPALQKYSKLYIKLTRKVKKVENMINNLRLRKDWIVTYDDKVVKFTPTTPQLYYHNVFGKANHVIISSATPPRPADLGMYKEAVNIISVPSVIPKENRPFVYMKCGRMASKYRRNTYPSVANMIKLLAKGKTIVHCHSYDIMDNISRELAQTRTPHVRQDKRAEFIDEWQKQKNIDIGLSVNFTEGIDLKDDMARTNIIIVLPFPDLMDPVIQKRMELEGKGFIYKIVADKIVQAYGRTTRDPEDYSTTYMLASEWGWFWSQNWKLFPLWFREVVP